MMERKNVRKVHLAPADALDTPDGRIYNENTISLGFHLLDIAARKPPIAISISTFEGENPMRLDLRLSTQTTKSSHYQYVWLAFALLGLLIILAFRVLWPLPSLLAQGTTPPDTAQAISSELVPLDGITQVAVGHNFTCALTNANDVKCWGYNGSQVLGNGSTVLFRNIPVVVVGLNNDVAAVDAGYYHVCVLTSARGIKCWGGNSNGQLGNDTSEPFGKGTPPSDVVGLGDGVMAIAVGGAHTCALTTLGAVKCWGNNFYGQLGDGTKSHKSIPVDIVGLSGGVVAIAAGGNGTCALTALSEVKCWGTFPGDGTTEHRTTPVDVIGLDGQTTAMALGGDSHTCILTALSGVKCWGWNAEGQLGDGTTVQRTTPVDVSGLGNSVAAIGMGRQHSCAVNDKGGVTCWGRNDAGQLGDGTTVDRTTPADVSGLGSGTVAVDGGFNHTCVLTSVGGVKCWGDNSVGELGDGTTVNRVTPVDVLVEVDFSNQIFLPLIKGKGSGATTSSATLAQPPARGQLGLLGGLLAAGFAIGMALVFWGEPETMETVQSADEQQTDDITQA